MAVTEGSGSWWAELDMPEKNASATGCNMSIGRWSMPEGLEVKQVQVRGSVGLGQTALMTKLKLLMENLQDCKGT